MIAETAVKTDLIAVMDSRKWPLFEKDAERVLPHIAFYFTSGAGMLPGEILQKDAACGNRG